MKKIITLAISVCIMAVFAAASIAVVVQCDELADTPPVMKDVRSSASTSFDKKTGQYIYNYTFANSEKNTGCIIRIGINIERPAESVELPTEGLVDYPKYVDKTEPSRMKTQIVPVAFPDLPMVEYQGNALPLWHAGTTVYGYAVWANTASTWAGNLGYMLPGKSVTGFVMTSYGPPAIREFKAWPSYLAGDEDMYRIGATEEDLIVNKAVWAIKATDSIAFRTKTIGPTAPPAELDLVAFLNGIIDMKHEAFKLGWITKESIELSLDQKLENARAKLEAGQTKTAANILGAFINEVEAQGCTTYEEKCPEGKALKPEAYALLKYNAQYLIDNLK